MSKHNDYIFVLWGAGFDEATATIFITELRKAGLLVKVVGLHSGQISGANGLALLPDLTLGKALARAFQATCVVIPCQSFRVEQLKNDPRLLEFFDRVHANQAKFVIGHMIEADLDNLKLLPSPSTNVIFYPTDQEELTDFVRELAGLFSIKK